KKGGIGARGSEASAFGAGFPLLRGNEKEIPSQQRPTARSAIEAPAPRVSLAFIKQVNEVTSKVAFKLPSEHSEGNKPLKSQGERCSEEGRNRSRGSEASAFGSGFPLLRRNEKEIPSQQRPTARSARRSACPASLPRV
ncbi:hypothetical protein DC345_23870, partial [Paenibacillus taichungensis]